MQLGARALRRGAQHSGHGGLLLITGGEPALEYSGLFSGDLLHCVAQDAGVVEAAQSMGASTLQIVWKVYLPEAKPSLILGGAISLVTILAYTAIAGTVGAGGLGDIAVRYGHQRGITSVMWVTVVFLIILVQVVQLIFNWLSRRIDKRLDQPSGAKKSGPLDLLARFAHTK